MKREFERPAPQEVFYVEDHPTNVLLMKAVFKRRPHLRLVVAGDGQEARNLARGMQPSLLLLDLRLPDCHGADLLKELRQFEGWDAVPAVAVTGEQGFEVGGTGFCEVWPKPIDLGFVLKRLDQLAAQTQAEMLGT